MSEWLDMFGMDVKSMIGTAYTNQESSHSQSQFDTTVGLVNQREISLANLMDTRLSCDSMISSSGRDTTFRFPRLADRVASKASPFGQGLLITDVRGRAAVTVVNGGVVQSVLASVLNASEVLDLSYSGKEQYYFLKVRLLSFL